MLSFFNLRKSEEHCHIGIKGELNVTKPRFAVRLLEKEFPVNLKCSIKCRTVLLYVLIESHHCLWIGFEPSYTHRQSEY